MPSATSIRILAVAALIALGGAQAGAAVDPSLPSGNILFWPPAQRPAGFSHMEKIYPTKTVKAGGTPYPLPKAPHELKISYTVAGKAMTTDSFMAANNVAGLLVIKDGRILIERYRLGLTPTGRWTSFSTAKSVTSTLIGAAIKDGFIKSLDDPITQYIPRLKGSSYDGVTMRDMLMMSSGVKWNEDYEDHNSDAAKLKAIDEGDGTDIVDYMATLPRISPPGKEFLYRTGDSHLLGIALSNAVGMPASEYLSKKIWQPFGMQQDAFWLTSHGRETGGSGLSMALRDFGRFGLFFLGGGVAGGQKVLPDGWTKDATAYHLRTDWGDVGYGYQWWVWKDGSYRALGIFGQMIYTDPAKKLVIVALSAWPHADADPTYDVENHYIDAVRKAVR